MTLQILVMRVLIILMSTLFGLAGCSSLPSMSSLSKYNLLSPYKLDVRQGNYFTADMVDKLQIGMTRPQVQFVMGTPLVNDIFHANRWDYVYYLRHEGVATDSKRVALFFTDDKLARIVRDMGKDSDPATQAVTPTGKV